MSRSLSLPVCGCECAGCGGMLQRHRWPHARLYVKSSNGRFSGSFSRQLQQQLGSFCRHSFIATSKTERRPENHFSEKIYVTFLAHGHLAGANGDDGGQ